MIDVLVTGAGGRMGREVLRAVAATDDMRIVAAVDPALAGSSLPEGVPNDLYCCADLLAAIQTSRPHVMVDFTNPHVVERNARVALDHGVDCVVGTTGIDESVLQKIARDAPAGACLFYAPNFAIGAVLMMRFASYAARYMPHAEVIELHHDHKVDAPSGTALRTAKLIAQSRATSPGRNAHASEIVSGARGGRVEDVPVHSIRLPGLVAHQEVIFGEVGQTLSIRHDSIDRTSFMPGVLLAIRSVRERSGYVVGLEALMAE